ncbi:hypothetical protein GLAREA_06153 [Glarea lozoyensis ATCC 20868]|uniref:Uncharacterized protein n=1 Tax=Glarea lozoyensis (strain ATCC 20868 / MF5171) TaxID=1116229 RepID=S3DM42_GLAL2|nr:uncharacterized protein GLAREA_06153 [Glarea lozoyensis ATCC 20868]EPE33141.1 hypothetical protein GLAREA_06153 [Glarea lozoyensis ATCC 20868]
MSYSYYKEFYHKDQYEHLLSLPDTQDKVEGVRAWTKKWFTVHDLKTDAITDALNKVYWTGFDLYEHENTKKFYESIYGKRRVAPTVDEQKGVVQSKEADKLKEAKKQKEAEEWKRADERRDQMERKVEIDRDVQKELMRKHLVSWGFGEAHAYGIVTDIFRAIEIRIHKERTKEYEKIKTKREELEKQNTFYY